jgi:hypothetical protein
MNAEPNSITFSASSSTWVMRITADRRIEVNEDVDVTEAAQAVLDAMQHLLLVQRPWVGLTLDDLEFWVKELGQGELGRGVIRAVADHLKETNT